MSIAETELRALLDEREIRAVLMRLARGTDRRDSELIRSCYHADGFDDHGAFRGSPADFAEWVPKTLAMFECTMHVLGNISIEVAPDRRTAWTESYCTAHHVFPASDPGGVRDSIMGLRYVDRFERRAGDADAPWLIANRLCAYEYAHVVTPAETWPLDPPFVRGTSGPDDPSYDR